METAARCDRGYKVLDDLLQHSLPKPHLEYSHAYKLLEYMSCGKPVIASNLPGIRNVIESTRCGLNTSLKRLR